MLIRRHVLIAEVREVRRTERIAISTPGDFRLSSWHRFGAGATLLPYCFDFARGRALYVGGVDVQGAMAAPFYYLHLRRHAKSVVSVPWEHGALTAGAPRSPIFVFSPGRCGSTLLSRMLAAGGVPNVSEPDFYTQATTAVAASALNPSRRSLASVAAAMGADLCAALDPARPPVVKLRAESCRAPELLVQPSERRTLFLTRGFEAWARSNGRAFRNGPGKTVRKYLTALSGYAWLKANSNCLCLRYEAMISDPAATAAALSRFLAQPLDPARLAATMTEDSQEGTPLRRGARPDLPGWEDRFAATMALWNSAKVRRLREALRVDQV